MFLSPKWLEKSLSSASLQVYEATPFQLCASHNHQRRNSFSSKDTKTPWRYWYGDQVKQLSFRLSWGTRNRLLYMGHDPFLEFIWHNSFEEFVKKYRFLFLYLLLGFVSLQRVGILPLNNCPSRWSGYVGMELSYCQSYAQPNKETNPKSCYQKTFMANFNL